MGLQYPQIASPALYIFMYLLSRLEHAAHNNNDDDKLIINAQ